MKQLGLVLRSIWNSRTIRAKLLAVFALTALFRFLAHVPLPGVDVAQLQSIFAQSQLLGMLDIFSGGTLANFSLLAVGISPYITASILVQVSGLFFPRIKEMQKESEATRAQLTQWMRIFSVPIGVIQSLSLLFLLRSQGLLTVTDPLAMMTMILSLVTGSLVVMWLGEQLTRYGIGNGVSWIIFVGIVSQIPSSLGQTYAMRDSVGTTVLLALALGLAFVMGSVVFMAEAVRRLPLQQAKRTQGNREYGGSITYLPIKVNQFGVMPVIFALPLLTMPVTIATLLMNIQGAPTWVLTLSQQLQLWFRPGDTVYNTLYFLFVFAFTFFSIFVYFNPKDFAEDLKKSGTYVPGVRPGKPTADLLLTILLRLSFIGGLYLGIVALLPILAQSMTGIATVAVGGTGLLIVVSVVLESVQAIQSQLIQDQYDQYLDKEEI